MHQGNWKCSGCGGTITELPFIPRSESGLTCRTCYAKGKSREAAPAPEMAVASEAPDIPDFAEVADGPAPTEDFADGMNPVSSEKPKFTGNWQCSGCGGTISSLPFQPRDTSNLKCLDCFKKSKA
ncbi:MAG: hypothetical protein R3B53_03125 [Candidatus Paceibacterota bacterium]